MSSAPSLSVSLNNLKFSFGENRVLDIPELSVKKSEVVFLHGPSGCGKSTLLEILAGVLRPSSGRIEVCGQNLSTMTEPQLDRFRAENVGYIFQSFNLIPYLSVLQNIELPFLFKNEKVDSSQLQDLLQHLGLQDFLSRPVSNLSVGQQQRVAVARALIKNPKLILADEPTSALDYNHRENFLKILFELCRKNQTTVIFVSHDLTIETFFDRSLSLRQINKIAGTAVDVL